YPSGPRGTTRLTTTEMIYNQLDLSAVIDTGGIEHTLTIGASYAREDYQLDNGNVQRNAGGLTPNPALPPIDIANPDPIYGGPINFVRTGHQEGQTENVAVYL